MGRPPSGDRHGGALRRRGVDFGQQGFHEMQPISQLLAVSSCCCVMNLDRKVHALPLEKLSYQPPFCIRQGSLTINYGTHFSLPEADLL
jgi:hypothetical protein